MIELLLKEILTKIESKNIKVERELRRSNKNKNACEDAFNRGQMKAYREMEKYVGKRLKNE